MPRIFLYSFTHYMLLLGLAATGSFANAASVSLITDRASLGSNDSIGWGQLGQGMVVGTNTPISNPAVLTSIGGINASLSSPGPIFRWDQDDGWNGDFDSNSELVVSIFGASKELTIDFATPIFGAGAQIQTEDVGASGTFSGQIEAFDSNNQSLGSFQSDAANNEILFIGILSDTLDIDKITFSLAGSNKGFAINTLDINVSPVPLPGAIWLLISGLGVLGFRQRLARFFPSV